MNKNIRKYFISVVFLFVVYCCAYIPTSDNPIRVFLQNPVNLYWAITAQFSIHQNSSSEIHDAISDGLQAYRFEYFPSYEKIIGANCSRFHGTIQGLLDIRKIGNIIKLNTGNLARLHSEDRELKEEELAKIQKSCQEFQQVLKSCDIPLLFVLLPDTVHKIDQQFPVPFHDVNNYNGDTVYSMVTRLGIDCIDIRDLYLDNPQKHYSLYFIGDHHWKAPYAFEAFKTIMIHLDKIKHYSLSPKLLDISSYSIVNSSFPWKEQTIYRDVGIYYTTVCEQREWILSPNHEFVKLSSPQTGLEIFTNDHAEIHGSIFVIHDSYFNYMQDSMAGLFDTIYSVDLRQYTGNVTELIKKFQPEYVIYIHSVHQLEWRTFRLNKSSSFPGSNLEAVNPI